MEISNYLSKIKEISTWIREALTIINDEELALYTLGGLNGEFHAFTTAIATRIEDNSFSSLKGLLLAYETSLQQNSSEVSIALAHIAQNTQYNKVSYQICERKDTLPLHVITTTMSKGFHHSKL